MNIKTQINPSKRIIELANITINESKQRFAYFFGILFVGSLRRKKASDNATRYGIAKYSNAELSRSNVINNLTVEAKTAVIKITCNHRRFLSHCARQFINFPLSHSPNLPFGLELGTLLTCNLLSN